MNAKTINKVIRKKLADWLSSIDDLELIKQIEKDVIVTGGCIASMLLNEEVNDYDLYFKTKETALKIANYYCTKFNNSNQACAEVQDEEGRIKIYIKSKGVATEKGSEEILESGFSDAVDALSKIDDTPLVNTEEKPKYRPIFLSSNAITLAGAIQIIVRFYGEADEIHSNYDFAHCTNYWTYETGTTLNAGALAALLTKELVYMGSKYPLCSIIRTRKFIKRGFHINAGQYLKMCFQLNELDLHDVKVLEDQLIGVDSSYFNILIDGINKKIENDPNFKITTPYVTSIIDKIF
jgi:hypothetical protein